MRVENASVDSMTAWLATAAPFGAGAARRAALEAATEPRWATATLAMWNLEALREEAERRAGPQFDAAGFHDAVIREGSVPTPWVSENVLAARPPKKRKS